MKKVRLLGAALAACFAVGAGTAQAASVTLPGWAFGEGNAISGQVGVNALNVYAGGFGGTLADAGRFDNASFLTYCIELEEAFGFSTTAMTGYRIVEGVAYFSARRDADPSRPDGASVADRLGRLLTYVDENPSAVDTAIESTAMQLAIWNIVYDSDAELRPLAGSAFSTSARSNEKFARTANALLAGAAGVGSNRFTVYALSRDGTQDFLLGERTPVDVPEPATALLTVLALAGAAGASGAAKRRLQLRRST